MVEEVTERIRILLDLEKEAHDRAVKASAREVIRLEKQYDPLARAVVDFERKQERLNRALEAGTIDAQQHARIQDQMQREYEQTTAAVQRQTVAMSSGNGLAGAIGRNRSAFQQLGYQVGDAAVQIQGGTSAVTALTQQGSQLLGVFGAYGAIAGAVLAIGAPLAASFMKSAEGAESLDDALKGLSDAMSRLRDAQANATMGRGDLSAEYGAMADAAKKLFEIERQIAELRAEDQLAKVGQGLADSAGLSGAFRLDPQLISDAVQARRDLLAENEALALSASNLSDIEFNAAIKRQKEIDQELRDLKAVGRAVGDLAESLGITEDQAEQVAARFAEISRADNAEERAQAYIDLAAYISDVSSGLADATDEGDSLYDSILEAVAAALDLAAIDYATNIGAGADEAGRLYANLAAALNLSDAVRSRTTQAGIDAGEIPPWAAEDLPQTAADRELEKALEARRKAARASAERASRGGGGRGGGGGGGAKARVKGVEDEAQAIRILGQEYEVTKDQAKLLESVQTQMVDGFMAAVIEGENLGDVLENLAATLAKVALQSAIFGQGPGLFGGGMSGGIFGKLFSFDGGGFTGAGPRAGGIDGRGGFPAILHPNETVVDHTATSRGSAGQTQRAEITVRAAPGVTIEQVRGEARVIVQQAAPGIVDRSVSASHEAALATKSYTGF